MTIVECRIIVVASLHRFEKNIKKNCEERDESRLKIVEG